MTPILEIRDVVKEYQSHRAVDQVNFTVPRGCIFGLLGPNGAGKTTLIRIITTIIQADRGEIILDGEKLSSDHPEIIGYMPEERGLYKKMKVGDHLLYLARLKGLSTGEAKQAIHEWMDKFDINDWWDKKIQELSKGMQQKIQFIATVVHRPKLLILDEPFSGLDPINTNLIKDEIRQMRDNGISIIFSTHRMEQVEEICERIVLIHEGRNVLEGDMMDIKQAFKENIFQINFTGTLPEILDKYGVIEKNEHQVIIQVGEDGDSNELLRDLINSGAQIQAFNEVLPSLNEIFIRQVDTASEKVFQQ